jgi:hypothetical protein
VARGFQLDPVAGLTLDPGDVLTVDRTATEIARRASQLQVVNGLLSQLYNPAVVFPTGSFGALLLAGGGGGGAISGFISGFASTPGPLVETGVTVTNPTLAWTVNGVTVTSQGLAGPLAVALTPTQRGVTLSGSLTADAIWSLTINGGGAGLTAQATLGFGHRIHYGRGVLATPDAAGILAFSGSLLAAVPDGDFSFVANDGSHPYWWFCYPDSWGAVTVRDVATGLPVAVFDAGTVSVTNVVGHTRNFRCLRSLNALNAAMTVRIS